MERHTTNYGTEPELWKENICLHLPPFHKAAHKDVKAWRNGGVEDVEQARTAARNTSALPQHFFWNE